MTLNFGQLRPAILRGIQIVFTVGVLVVLWNVVDGWKASETLASAKPIWLIAGVLALAAQTVLSAIRWRITAVQLGLVLPVNLAIQEYYVSQMINQVVPGGVLGDASRAVRSRGQQGLVAASQAVIFERFSGQVAMFIVMTVAVVATFLTPGGLDWPSWSIPFVLLVILGGLATAMALVLATIVTHPLRSKARTVACAMVDALLARKVVIPQIALSVAVVLCNLAAFAFCARAVGVVLPLIVVCALVPLILFTMLVPLTVMGWGLREGAAAAFLPLAGVTASTGLAASVAFGITMLVASTPGLVFLWVGQKSVEPNEDIRA